MHQSTEWSHTFFCLFSNKTKICWRNASDKMKLWLTAETQQSLTQPQCVWFTSWDWIESCSCCQLITFGFTWEWIQISMDACFRLLSSYTAFSFVLFFNQTLMRSPHRCGSLGRSSESVWESQKSRNHLIRLWINSSPAGSESNTPLQHFLQTEGSHLRASCVLLSLKLVNAPGFDSHRWYTAHTAELNLSGP